MAPAVVDTNVLVRHVTGDPPDQARRATRFLETSADEELLLTAPVFAELVFVLSSNYGYARDVVQFEALGLLSLPSILAPSFDVLSRALVVYGSSSLHFVDAYAVAYAEARAHSRVASFDRGLDRIPTIERVEP